MLPTTRHTQQGHPDWQGIFTGLSDVQDTKNQVKPVVCETKASVGVSKPLNHLQMTDFWPVSHQTLCVHGFRGRRNPTWRQASTRIVDYYYVWKACDDTGASLTCSGQLHIKYVEPVPTGQKHVAGSSYPYARAGHCSRLGLGEIGHLLANHGHVSRDMDIFPVDKRIFILRTTQWMIPGEYIWVLWVLWVLWVHWVDWNQPIANYV